MYTVMCYPNGGIVDDCIVYRRAADDFLIVLNAGNIDKDLAWLREHCSALADVIDESEATALIAVQGPKAVALVDALSPAACASIARFHFASADVAGVPCMVARTGYTGEDGFELACPANRAADLWNAVVEAGAAPIGLGARDTLRLEARLCLYGNDIDETTTPYEAGLGWVVKLEHGEFVGREALVAHKQAGISRRLIGFRVDGKGTPRHGWELIAETGDKTSEAIGHVTSGGPAPTVGGSVGIGYAPDAHSKPGTRLLARSSHKLVPVEIVKGPFYKRAT
jgi:aminomethyltransferase